MFARTKQKLMKKITYKQPKSLEDIFIYLLYQLESLDGEKEMRIGYTTHVCVFGLAEQTLIQFLFVDKIA
jgi:hypothetical protein